MAEKARRDRDRLQIVVDGNGGRRIVDGNGEIQKHEPPPGRSIESMAEDGGEQEYLIMPVITGSQQTLNGKVGGRSVTSSELKFKGGPLVMTGQFPEGARVRVIMEFEIADVDFKRVTHQGHIVGKKRVHVGELMGYTQCSAEGTLTELAEAVQDVQRQSRITSDDDV